MLDSALPKIQGDANQIEQVFLNLTTNAMDSIKSRIVHEKEKNRGQNKTNGIIEIQTRICPHNDKWIEALVIDNGSGIDAGVREKIFDPFFTTKGHEGTGLGLTVISHIVNLHQGKLIIENNKDGGARSVVYLKTSNWEG